MKIKGFEDFCAELTESYRDRDYMFAEPEGKTSFSKWLRGVSQRMKNEVIDIKSESPGGYGSGFGGRFGGYGSGSGLGTADIYAQSRAAKEVFPGLIGLFTAGAAAVADFFKTDKGVKSGSDKIKKSKDEVLDDWEKSQIGSKEISQKDAEDFYKSGVLKGKQYFGSGYDPFTPKTKDEQTFSDYLNSATKRYYDRTTVSK
jgi:hypothetical protein